MKKKYRVIRTFHGYTPQERMLGLWWSDMLSGYCSKEVADHVIASAVAQRQSKTEVVEEVEVD
jgi:hypothetical protein